MSSQVTDLFLLIPQVRLSVPQVRLSVPQFGLSVPQVGLSVPQVGLQFITLNFESRIGFGEDVLLLRQIYSL